MGIFNNYHKPGPGVSKNQAYQANRFSLYFQLLGRKFWNICILNLTMLLYTLPYIGLTFALYKLFGLIPFLASDLGFQFRILLAFLPFGLYGPVLSASFKIGRDFAREQPVFLFSEFWDSFKTNARKAIPLSLVSSFFFGALTFALPAYFSMKGIGTYALFPLCLLAGIMLLFAQFYLYTMAACFDLSIREIAKNGLIFAFLCIFRNLLLFVIFLALLALCVEFLLLSFQYSILFGILMILLACFIPAFFVFTVSFVTDPALQHYVVDPYYHDNPQKTSAVLQYAGEPDTNSLENREPIQKELPEYVYHNGRMVHRSVLESDSVFDDDPIIKNKD